MNPFVLMVRTAMGVKKFNTLRGKAIALHSQVITDFCKYVGANQKIRQGLIRVARSNGHRLGLLD